MKDYMSKDTLLDMFHIDEQDLIFNKGDTVDYINTTYRKLDRVECGLLVYLYRIHNNEVAYQILYEEILTIYKKHLKGKHFKTLNTTGNSPDLDIFQDYSVVFDKIIKAFRLTEMHSFKKYANLVIKGEIQSLITTKYYYIYKAPVSKANTKLVSMKDANKGDIYSEIESDVDLSENLESKMRDSELYIIIKGLLDSGRLDREEFNMFLDFNGIFKESMKLKDMSDKYGYSMSYISKKVSKVRETLLRNKTIRESHPDRDVVKRRKS